MLGGKQLLDGTYQNSIVVVMFNLNAPHWSGPTQLSRRWSTTCFTKWDMRCIRCWHERSASMYRARDAASISPKCRLCWWSISPAIHVYSAHSRNIFKRKSRCPCHLWNACAFQSDCSRPVRRNCKSSIRHSIKCITANRNSMRIAPRQIYSNKCSRNITAYHMLSIR